MKLEIIIIEIHQKGCAINVEREGTELENVPSMNDTWDPAENPEQNVDPEVYGREKVRECQQRNRKGGVDKRNVPAPTRLSGKNHRP